VEVLGTAEAGLLDNKELGMGVSPGRTPIEPLAVETSMGTGRGTGVIDALAIGVSPGSTPMEPATDVDLPPWSR
jgi:hypothetical protein